MGESLVPLPTLVVPWTRRICELSHDEVRAELPRHLGVRTEMPGEPTAEWVDRCALGVFREMQDRQTVMHANASSTFLHALRVAHANGDDIQVRLRGEKQGTLIVTARDGRRWYAVYDTSGFVSALASALYGAVKRRLKPIGTCGAAVREDVQQGWWARLRRRVAMGLRRLSARVDMEPKQP